MKWYSTLIVVACLSFAFAGCKQEKKQQSGSSDNPLTAPADYVGALGKAQKSAQKTIGANGLDQAIKTFFAEEGRFPKSLEELTSKGATVPPPPPGMKWDYDANSGVVKPVPQ